MYSFVVNDCTINVKCKYINVILGIPHNFLTFIFNAI